MRVYILQKKVNGVWERFYAGSFNLSAEQAAWANQACQPGYRFVLDA